MSHTFAPASSAAGHQSSQKHLDGSLSVGDVVDLPHASLSVDAMDGRRVTRLHVRPRDPEAAPGGRDPEEENR